MNVHPFKNILKPNRGYVCFSCLLKQSAPRYRQNHRYQSTLSESTPSSTTENRFVVEGVVLGHGQGSPSKNGSELKANAPDQPPNTQQNAEQSNKEGKPGEVNVGNKKHKPREAKKKLKPKKVGKNAQKLAVPSDGTASAANPIETTMDGGETNPTEKAVSASVPQPTAAKRRQRRRRRADRKKMAEAGQGVVSAEPPDKTSGDNPSLIRKIESRVQHEAFKKPEPISAEGTEGRIPKSDSDPSSSTSDQTPRTRRVESTGSAATAKSVVRQTMVKSGMTTVRMAAQLLGRANGVKRKAWEERKLRLDHVRSKLKKSLESAVAAQKKSLKDKDVAVKTIESKAKRPRKTSPEKATGSPNKVVARSKSKTIPQIDGHMSLKDALKTKPNPDLEGLVNDEIEQVEAKELVIAPVQIAQPPVPGLSYGLERVLFNPGVYHVQDPRSRVFNFDPYLQKIMPVAEFDFNALKEYITSSRDQSLKAIAQEHGKRYVGSSSSMTAALAHFHFLLSQWRPINTSMLSQGFPDKLRSFTALQRCPSAIFLRWKNGTYAIDADKEFDTANILSMLGKSMEKLLTLSTEDYERYRKTSSGQVSDEERNSPESFHYSTIGDFLMRSQLDAHDARLPGTGMFDLKTRAVVSIRMDAKNYEHGVGYQIKTRQGEWESFEREYFDMIRSAFLKYSLQVRMGRMDGIFVAFHNTERIFGFQYISLSEMDNCLHGQWDTTLGDQEFKLSLSLLNKVLDRATKKFPEQSLRIHFETRELKTPFMYIIAEPVTEEQVQEIQSRNKSKIEDFERSILGLHKDVEDEAASGKSVEEDASDWKDIHAKVEEEVTKDELSSEPSTTQSSELATIDAASEVRTPEEPPTISNFPGSGTFLGQSSPEEGSEHIAAATVDDPDEEVDDEEEDDADEGEEDEEDEEDDVEEDDEEEGQEEGKTAGAREGMEQNSSGTIEEEGLVHDPSESDLGEHKIEELTADETPSTEDVSAVLSNDGEQKASGVVQEGSPKTSGNRGGTAKKSKKKAEDEAEQSSPLLAMTLTVRNKVDDKYVVRPENLHRSQKWAVEYSLAEIPSASRAWSLYGACQMRRKKKLDDDDVNEEDVAKNYYLRRMREMSEQGRKWRKQQDRIESKSARVVLDRPNPSNQSQAIGPSE